MLSASTSPIREIALDYMRAYLPVVEEAIAPEVDGRRRKDAAALTLAVIRGPAHRRAVDGRARARVARLRAVRADGRDAGLLVGVRSRDDR